MRVSQVRAPNQIDFWRGCALVMIFVNHVPGMIYSRLTLHDYAISDAAELFVFLAGCSLVYVSGPPNKRKPASAFVSRMLRRSFDLWRAQLIILWLAVMMIGAFAMTFQAPELFYWHNAGPAFYDTGRALLGSLMMTYQIGYFNILPLYVALLVIASVPLLIAQRSRPAALALSLSLYLIALAYQLNLIHWPTRGSWHFNPLAWQLNIVLGYICADALRDNAAFRDLVHRLKPVAIALVALGAAVVVWRLWPSYKTLPSPKVFFAIDKGWLSPVRMISMLALAVAFYGLFDRFKGYIPKTSEFMSSLGRNSLPVFCVLSLLALAAQMIRHLAGDNFVLDTVIVIVGVVAMRVTAMISESPQDVVSWLKENVPRTFDAIRRP